MKNKIVSSIFILFISHFTHWSRRSNILLVLLCVGGFLIPNSSIAYAIEVGGHLIEDTTWSPEDNPYLVTSGVYVDAGVTLTILPGTIVKFYADYYDDMGDDQFYFHSGEEPVAKFMRVEGKIIAEGTEQDSIIFTRMQDVEYYHWGTIYLPEGADKSIFKYCLFEYSAFTGFSLSEQPRAAIAMWNGSAMIDKCDFIDNDTAIYIRNNVTEIQITNNYFDNIDYAHPNIMNHFGYFISAFYIFNIDTGTPLIAGNNFMHGTAIRSSKSMYFVNNSIESVLFNRKAIYLSITDGKSYFYNNAIGSCSTGINSHSNGLDSLYIKNNFFATDGGEGIAIDDAYVEISDNYFEGCGLYSDINNTGIVFNNITNNGYMRLPGYLEVNNNLSYNGSYIGVEVSWRNISCLNNLTINNDYAIGSGGTVTYNNCIFLENEEINYFPINGNPTFRNCILDFELPPECIDGGGNIWVDSLQAQSLFEDITNGDFHLIEGSLAIDAGFDTLSYYYPFDMDYNHRIWDGDNNGSAIIDIGPYEFGSPAFGGIEGYAYNPTTGDPVDYVLLNINNQPGEFTFSDSIGNFKYKLPSGIYDVYAERVFYEDVIEYQVEVIDGQFTQIAIPMLEIVDVEEQTIPNPSSQISNLTNYPNPFNPTTTISFSVTQNSDFVNLEVYNIKGQKVKTFSVTLSGGEGSDNNYINTPRSSNTLRMTQAGSTKYSVIWNGTNENNQPVSSGVYMYQLKINDKVITYKKCLLLK